MSGGPRRRQPHDQPAAGPRYWRRRWSEFARQLSYKAAWFGAELVVCDRWFASTKTCSRAEVKEQIGWVKRVFRCAGCSLVIDRDRKLAANLALGPRVHAPGSGPPSGRPGNQCPLEGRAGRRLGDGGTSPSEGGTDAHAFGGVS